MMTKRHIVDKFKTVGAKKEWIIALWSDGEYSCSCPSWTFRKEKRDCRHIALYKKSLSMYKQQGVFLARANK